MGNIINKIVESELCVGCGACTYNNDSTMEWNKYGFLIPSNIDQLPDNAHRVCPFNLEPEDVVRTEDELSAIFLKDAPNHDKRIGKYFDTYVGYSKEFRETSSSGGIATYVLKQLLESKIVDFVLSVGAGTNSHYTYKIVSTKEELLETSKTKYYPVSMSEVLKQLRELKGNVAIVGTACFIKAVRLLQFYDTEINSKVKFTVGIICGGQKSKYYTDFLASHLNLSPNCFIKPEFRIKDKDSYALDYSFGCTSANKKYQLKMQPLGDMWGTGLFKNNACDFCDDVTSELADISLGDAWLNPYSSDGRGTNVVVVRSDLAEDFIRRGVKNGELKIENLSFSDFLRSQSGSFNHRHKGLNYRIKESFKKGLLVPPKRHNIQNIRYDFKLVQNQRARTRSFSLESWSRGGISEYKKVVPTEIDKLRRLTRLNHYIRAIKNKLSL